MINSNMTTVTRKKKTLVEKRRDAVFISLEQWRKRNAKALRGWDTVAAVRKIRSTR